MFSRFKWRWWWWKFTTARKIKDFFRKYSILKYGSILFLIAFVGVFLGMFILVGTSGQTEKLSGPERNESIGAFHWHRLYEIDTFGQILASPLIGDFNETLGGDILIANSLGAVYAFAGNDGGLLYQFTLEGRVVASPSLITLGTNHRGGLIREPLVIDENGVFYALAVVTGATTDDYLYRSREQTGRLGNKIFGKPAYGVFSNAALEQGMIFVAGNDGIVSSYESFYGRLVWTNDISFNRDEDIFAPPVLLLRDSLVSVETETVIIASTLGKVVGLAMGTGAPLWNFHITNEAARFREQSDGVRSAMNVGDFTAIHTGKEVALLTYRGKGVIFSPRGTEICDFYTKGYFISALGKGRFYTSLAPLALLAISTDGLFYTITTHNTVTPKSSAEGGTIECRVSVFTERKSANFLGSPVIADFNLDGVSDILIASRQGELFFINGRNGENLIAPLALGYALTATPAVADLTGDGSLEVIVAGENGTVTVLSLLTTPSHAFKPYQEFSTMFLKDIYNHN